jgi:hypothetical protein
MPTWASLGIAPISFANVMVTWLRSRAVLGPPTAATGVRGAAPFAPTGLMTPKGIVPTSEMVCDNRRRKLQRVSASKIRHEFVGYLIL